MAEQPFAIAVTELARQFPGEFQLTDYDEQDITAHWLDERNEPIAAARVRPVVLPPLEQAREDEAITAFAGTTLMVSDEPPPDSARAIRFERTEYAATFALAERAPRWVTERTTEPFGAATDRFEIRIFSELFTDFQKFEAKVGELHSALRGVDPFTQVNAAGKLRIVGHFARSPGAGGHFRTVPSGDPSERRILGDQVYARDRLSSTLNHMPALILIDSPIGGGAGGNLWNAKPYYPAWASVAPLQGQTPWVQVAIHELAHAFGLSDEYIDRKITDDRLPPKYGNVSNAARANGLSWNDLAGLSPATQLPTHEEDGTATNPAVTGPVAAFRGAYYRAHHWRPSRDCRMRNYRPGGFCQVCSRVIRKMYAMS